MLLAVLECSLLFLNLTNTERLCLANTSLSNVWGVTTVRAQLKTTQAMYV